MIFKSVTGFIYITLFAVMASYAQTELPKKTIKIAPVSNPSGEVAPTSSKSISYPSIFDKKDKLIDGVSLLKKKTDEQPSVMETEHFENPSKEYTDRMNKKRDGEFHEKFKSDSFLGQFKVGTRTLSIACRDHEYPDGDLVRIWLNDRVVVESLLLDVDYKEVFLELVDGINKIEIEALNQGESGPNTAQFVVYDGKKGMVTNNKWNLATGVKARLIILKDDSGLSKQ